MTGRGILLEKKCQGLECLNLYLEKAEKLLYLSTIINDSTIFEKGC